MPLDVRLNTLMERVTAPSTTREELLAIEDELEIMTTEFLRGDCSADTRLVLGGMLGELANRIVGEGDVVAEKDRAIALYKMALTILSPELAPRARLSALLNAADLMSIRSPPIAIKDPGEATAYYLEAISLSRSLGDEETFAEASLAYASSVRNNSGHSRDIIDQLSAAETATRSSENSELYCNVCLALASIWNNSPHLDVHFQEHARHYIRLARQHAANIRSRRTVARISLFEAISDVNAAKSDPSIVEKAYRRSLDVIRYRSHLDIGDRADAHLCLGTILCFRIKGYRERNLRNAIKELRTAAKLFARDRTDVIGYVASVVQWASAETQLNESPQILASCYRRLQETKAMVPDDASREAALIEVHLATIRARLDNTYHSSSTMSASDRECLENAVAVLLQYGEISEASVALNLLHLK